MVEYNEFLWLAQSPDSEERGQAAYMAASAYLSHSGPADEHAALYAVLFRFLEDPSVKVRAALAYGLLHSAEAPRPIIMALLHDSGVIARAVLQYSPVLIDAYIMPVVRQGEPDLLIAIGQRQTLSVRLVDALIARDHRQMTLKLLARADISIGSASIDRLVATQGTDAQMRGALLRRQDLPAGARLLLVQLAMEAMRGARIVKGAVAPERLNRLLRDSVDTAISSIGEREAINPSTGYAAELIASDRLNMRVLLHAMVTGHVMFFANCVAELSQSPRDKVFTVLEAGSRSAINALLVRCGMGPAMRDLLIKLIGHARAADLADDAAARHLVVTTLTESLIADHAGNIPEELEEAFAYLSEQNVALARKAAEGVMSAFAQEAGERRMVVPDWDETLALPAA